MIVKTWSDISLPAAFIDIEVKGSVLQTIKEQQQKFQADTSSESGISEGTQDLGSVPICYVIF